MKRWPCCTRMQLNGRRRCCRKSRISYQMWKSGLNRSTPFWARISDRVWLALPVSQKEFQEGNHIILRHLRELSWSFPGSNNDFLDRQPVVNEPRHSRNIWENEFCHRQLVYFAFTPEGFLLRKMLIGSGYNLGIVPVNLHISKKLGKTRR
jgi:hypothetical protein